MKRLVFLLTFLLLPSLARAQFQHASFFNGGTTLTATCTNTTSTTLSQDYFEGTLQGNTTVTLPAAAIGCLSGDIIVLKPTAAASQTFTLTVSAGTGTALKTPSNGSFTIPAPAGPASGATNNLNQIWIYNGVASTPQWELVTQEPLPAVGVTIPNNVCYYGLNTIAGQICLIEESSGNNVNIGPGSNGINLAANVTLSPSVTFQFNGDNAVSSMARLPLTFGTGNLTLSGLNGNNFAVYKVVKALTLENIEGVSIVDTSCAAGSVITIYDCGSSAPANAACSGGTAKANVTLSTTVGSAADGTITSANVAAGEYLGAQISTIGTSCTVLNSVVTLMARPQ